VCLAIFTLFLHTSILLFNAKRLFVRYLWRSINVFAQSDYFEFYAACTYNDCFHMFLSISFNSKSLPTSLYLWMKKYKTLNWMNRVSKKTLLLSQGRERCKPPQDIFSITVSVKSNTSNQTNNSVWTVCWIKLPCIYVHILITLEMASMSINCTIHLMNENACTCFQLFYLINTRTLPCYYLWCSRTAIAYDVNFIII
jgi:hypothetical protein